MGLWRCTSQPDTLGRWRLASHLGSNHTYLPVIWWVYEELRHSHAYLVLWRYQNERQTSSVLSYVTVRCWYIHTFSKQATRIYKLFETRRQFPRQSRLWCGPCDSHEERHLWGFQHWMPRTPLWVSGSDKWIETVKVENNAYLFPVPLIYIFC